MTINTDQKTKIRAIIDNFPNTQSAILPILFYLQEENRHLDEMLIWELSEMTMIDYQSILDLANYYVMLRPFKVGETLIRICTNVACTVKGQAELLDYVKDKLGINVGETTEDGKFTLLTAHCLACCDHGPAVQINDKYLESMNIKKLERVLGIESIND